MEKITFTTADGKKCSGYLFSWKGLSFGLTTDNSGSKNTWYAVELQTGRYVTGKRLATRKQALKDAQDLLECKGLGAVKRRLKEVFIERGHRQVNGKIKTTHLTTSDNMVSSLCGKIRADNCIPVNYSRCAKKPCKRCRQLASKKKTG